MLVDQDPSSFHFRGKKKNGGKEEGRSGAGVGKFAAVFFRLMFINITRFQVTVN